jgi:DNA-directed RNA polymerase subunit beta
MPNLINIQRRSFRWFLEEGLGELFSEISPIQDFTGKNMDLELAVPLHDEQGEVIAPGYSFGQSKYSEEECRETDSTYAAPLKVRMRLTIKGEIG